MKFSDRYQWALKCFLKYNNTVTLFHQSIWVQEKKKAVLIVRNPSNHNSPFNCRTKHDLQVIYFWGTTNCFRIVVVSCCKRHLSIDHAWLHENKHFGRTVSLFDFTPEYSCLDPIRQVKISLPNHSYQPTQHARTLTHAQSSRYEKNFAPLWPLVLVKVVRLCPY